MTELDQDKRFGLHPGSPEWVTAVKAHATDDETRYLCGAFEENHKKIVEQQLAIATLNRQLERMHDVLAAASNWAERTQRALLTAIDMSEKEKGDQDGKKIGSWAAGAAGRDSGERAAS